MSKVAISDWKLTKKNQVYYTKTQAKQVVRKNIKPSPGSLLKAIDNLIK